MAPVPFFTAENTAPAYQLRFHFAWRTYRRRPLLGNPAIQAAVHDTIRAVAEANDYHLLESSVESNAVYALLSLKPSHSPSQVTRLIKGNLATEVRNQFGIRELWSRGSFVRSVGAVTTDIVRKYVARQFEHHRAVPVRGADPKCLAKFHCPDNAAQVRTSDHAAFEYNLHIVMVTRRRCEFLDRHVSTALVDYWRHVCDKKNWSAWNIEIVPDHAHLLLGANPSDAPQEVALSLMNNAAHFLHQHYAAALEHEGLAGVWQPSFYVGTVGSATTAQVKAYLRDSKERGDDR